MTTNASGGAERIIKVYLVLTLLSTFASSFIWGINTLFLLDAGLTITQAFAANAFFTVGQVLFEVPTGVTADTVGRRASYLLGSATLFVATLLYLYLWHIKGPFWAWSAVSIMLGLGFAFFSGTTEAWLVDGLHATKYRGTLEAAFAKGQIATGVAMLTGTVAGGVIAQFTNLGVPYMLRAGMLALTFLVSVVMMRDVGFKPRKSASVTTEVRRIIRSSLEQGFGNPPVRWVMLAGVFTGGVGIYAFYAMQPYLLQLYGKTHSYAIAGSAAAIVAGGQILGGLIVPYAHKFFRRRTSLLLSCTFITGTALILIGLVANFWVALGMFASWAIVFAVSIPVRQAYINGLIPSDQRATLLSSDNLLSSAGGAMAQPVLGKVADVYSYGASYLVGAVIALFAVPFMLLARREKAASDRTS